MNDSFRLGDDGLYRCDALQQFVWQKHGFGTRLANPEVDVTLRQIHSSQVWNAHSLRNRQREGDALVADDVGLCIGVRTADCVPILLLDSNRRVVGAVHAGWRGSASEIVVRALERMNADFDSDPADVYAALGPCIRECCYQVGPEVACQFEKTFPEWGPVTASRPLDLAETNRRHLLIAGVDAGRIFDCGLCTACQSDTFFSFRREPSNAGRMVSAICRLA